MVDAIGSRVKYFIIQAEVPSKISIYTYQNTGRIIANIWKRKTPKKGEIMTIFLSKEIRDRTVIEPHVNMSTQISITL